MWKAFEHAVKVWFETKRCNEGLRANQQHNTAEGYWQAYLNGFEK